MKERMNVYFPPEMLRQLIDLSIRKRMSRSSIVEAAVASFLSPDGSERTEAVLVRRLDRLSRQVQRLERDLTISTEALALFVRFWLTVTPPLPADAQAGARAQGRERYEGFVEAVGKRLARGSRFLQDVSFERLRADGSDSPEKADPEVTERAVPQSDGGQRVEAAK